MVMMKSLSLTLLFLSVSGAVVKRQGHSHGDVNGNASPYGNPSAPGSSTTGLGVGQLPPGLTALIPGLENFKLPQFALPKDGFSAALKPKVRKAHKIELIPAQKYDGARRLRITYGPYKVRASSDKVNPGNSFSMDPQGTGYMDLAGQDFPRDILIVDADSWIVNETFGNALVDDGIYNHHTLFMDANKRSPGWLSCNGYKIPEPPGTVFMGSGSDENINRYNTANNSVKTGFYIGQNDFITFGLDVVNYFDRERTLWMVNEMEYFPGMPDGYTHSQNHVIPIGMCDGFLNAMKANNIHPPVDKKVFTMSGEKDIEIIRDGHLVATNGHLHDGGLGMDIIINGKIACATKLIYGGPGHEQIQPNGEVWKTIAKNVGCDEPIRVHKGDKVQLQAHFDFEKHPARVSAHGQEAEGMALVLTTFVPLDK